MTDSINMIKEIVSNKEQLIKILLTHLGTAQTAQAGLEKAAASVQANASEANTRKMLATTMKLVRQQQELNQTLISVVVMLASSRDFTGWQAELAMKLGSDPGEVLRQMMRDKMAGK